MYAFDTSGKRAIAERSNDVRDRCAADLAVLPGYLEANDSGATAHLAHHGNDIAASLLRAKAALHQIENDQQCLALLDDYVRSWRREHIGIEDLADQTISKVSQPSKEDQDRLPRLEWLSEKTVLLTLPSFFPTYREPLEALLKKHRAELDKHPYWLLDVRHNNGGSDSTYEVLLPSLLPTETVIHGVEWLATDANIAASQMLCPVVAPNDEECMAFVDKSLAKMKNAPKGTFVPFHDDGVIVFEKAEHSHPVQPERIAVLMGKACGSACEQFLLTIRQGFNVTLVGRPSRGSLDYSNLRPYDLPSGKRRLWYAISRSSRLSSMPIDDTGCQPDILLPVPKDDAEKADEIRKTQRWLETGLWR